MSFHGLGSRRGGRLLNIYETLLHSPALAMAFLEQVTAVHWKTQLDGQTRDIQVPDEVYAALRPHFSERQIVELTMLIGTYNMHTRVLQALEVDPTIPKETSARP